MCVREVMGEEEESKKSVKRDFSFIPNRLFVKWSGVGF